MKALSLSAFVVLVFASTASAQEAVARLPRARGDELLGRYRGETESLWRMIFFTTLVWEGRRGISRLWC